VISSLSTRTLGRSRVGGDQGQIDSSDILASLATEAGHRPGMGRRATVGWLKPSRQKRGKKYKVTFFMRETQVDCAQKKMAVRAAEQEKDFHLDTTGKVDDGYGWKQHTWESR